VVNILYIINGENTALNFVSEYSIYSVPSLRVFILNTVVCFLKINWLIVV